MFTKEVGREWGGGITGILTRGLITFCIPLKYSVGGSYGGILLGIIPRFWGGDPGVPPIPHHIQSGGGSSGKSLDLVDGRWRGREGRVGMGGDTLCRHFLRGLWPGRINGTGLVVGIA